MVRAMKTVDSWLNSIVISRRHMTGAGCNVSPLWGYPPCYTPRQPSVLKLLHRGSESSVEMHVLLLKEPREGGSGPDPYIKELASRGHNATLIPVLSFTFVSLNTLSDKLFQPEQHGGLIFTSPRAVEAVKMCLEDDERTEQWNMDIKDKWNAKSIYVVGKATATLGEDANILPLLFPCGSIKREVLPTALRENGVSLDTLMVYQTAPHPDLEKNLKNHFTEQGVPDSIAFFSPSGVKFCLETVRRLSGEQLMQIKFAAIGPTTAEAMTAEGLSVSCSADKPTAEHLAAGIAKALQ
uniref:Uroporphyrinogen III synthase n=1 Tax=Oncorhynchus mykiss TaxID=8022 RepID=A0A8C7RFG1_ONCMY